MTKHQYIIFRLFLGFFVAAGIMGCSANTSVNLPRKDASAAFVDSVEHYLSALPSNVELHSLMVVQHGNVIFERWLNGASAEEPHELHSVSKTFTSIAAGLAISEGKLKLTDRIVDIFPEEVPEEIGENLSKITIENLLTMTCGHEKDMSNLVRHKDSTANWVRHFMELPIKYAPGEVYCYNSLSTFMVSAAVQKVTGEKVCDYLQPRLFAPLGITDVTWKESPMGINCGGWGLFLKTEDLAKMGQLLLQGGKWGRKQLVPREWVETMSAKHVECVPAGYNTVKVAKMEKKPGTPDWRQGYGYQMWRCRHNAFRADGAYGQYVVVMPDQDAVVVMTADSHNLGAQLGLVWDYILPALEATASDSRSKTTAERSGN